jgi:hypothetical protein
MSYKKIYPALLCAGLLLSANFISCSKGGEDSPSDPCAGKTITITVTSTPSAGCGAPSGSITASATGSSGFTYKINTAASYQASGTFNGLPAGNYTISAKDVDGCVKTQNVSITSTGGTFTIATSVTTTSGCGSSDGSIAVTASGSSGYQYKLGAAGTYAATNTFNNLAEGSYTVFVRDGAGCENSQNATVGAGTPGPKFTAVRALLNARCISCHSGTAPAAGRDWSVNCNVVTHKALINQRAVIVGDMPQGGPPLSASEKAVITDWINAGGLLTN